MTPDEHINKVLASMPPVQIFLTGRDVRFLVAACLDHLFRKDLSPDREDRIVALIQVLVDRHGPEAGAKALIQLINKNLEPGTPPIPSFIEPLVVFYFSHIYPYKPEP